MFVPFFVLFFTLNEVGLMLCSPLEIVGSIRNATVERDFSDPSRKGSMARSLLPKQACDRSDIKFLFLVHSNPDDYDRRKVIRETWGSVKQIDGKFIRVVFVIGKQASGKPLIRGFRSIVNGKQRWIQPSNPNAGLDSRIDAEADKFGDIFQDHLQHGDDSIQKHLHLYQWIWKACQENSPEFIIKTNDHVFVETFHLFKFVNAIYGKAIENALICDVVPRGVNGSLSSNPEYCNGLAYLLSFDMSKKFVETSRKIKMDRNLPADLYLTGILRQQLKINPFYLNLRYTYNEKTYMKWLNSKSTLPLPYLFVRISTNANDWKKTVEQMWNKTLKIHNNSERT